MRLHDVNFARFLPDFERKFPSHCVLSVCGLHLVEGFQEEQICRDLQKTVDRLLNKLSPSFVSFAFTQALYFFT